MKSYTSRRSRNLFTSEKYKPYFEFIIWWIMLGSIILWDSKMAIVGVGITLYTLIIHRKNEYVDVKVGK